jgi:hypothetical protein
MLFPYFLISKEVFYPFSITQTKALMIQYTYFLP